MKTRLGIVMVVMFSLGAYATPRIDKESGTNHPGNYFSVELLDMSSEFMTGEDGKMVMNSVFIAKQDDSPDELFGSAWARFEIEQGSSADVYKTKNWMVEDIRLAEDLSPGEKAQIKIAFSGALERDFNEIPKSTIQGRIHSTEDRMEAGFNNEAPPIIFTNRPSSLIIIDGEPYYKDLNKRYSSVANAAAFILKDNNKDVYYMYGGGLWFSSESITGGWNYIERVPSQVNNVMRKHARELYDSMNDEEFQVRIIPEIIVSTEPAELISTDGNPKFVLIPNTKLHFVENTDAELFRDMESKLFYTLFSGRWFISDMLEGGWKYVAADALPADFAKIPESHEKSNVLVSVPGTKAAMDAVKDAQVPFVTRKDINTISDAVVSYSGEPQFVGIEGTELSYAVNTSNQILLWNDSYYMVDEAVWYFSSTPYGPWQIATYRPEGVENIPPGNPLYNIKYVYVYKNTDNVVYTGYTSGYTGSYVYGPTIVFGTGFHYHGWYGHYYFHYPMTYGHGIFYDPFYGWVPVYSPWYRPSFHWHWHWHYWYGYRPPCYRPPHNRPPRIEHYTAERPSVRPEQPIARPGQPTVRPEQPIARPDRPSTMPEQPGTRPDRPSTLPAQPSQPSVRPSQPSVRPSQPSTRPSQPAVRPAPPAARPSQPMARPSAPAARPAPAPQQRR